MSYSRWPPALLLLGISTLCIASPHRYECPAFLDDGQAKHSFAHVDVYDGPPQNGASGMPTTTQYGVRWDMTKGADIYLVCGYKGIEKTITIHAPEVTVCKGTKSPLAAFCD